MLTAAPGLDTDSRLSVAKPTIIITKALEETAARTWNCAEALKRVTGISLR
jgi:hypothetical protein